MKLSNALIQSYSFRIIQVLHCTQSQWGKYLITGVSQFRRFPPAAPIRDERATHPLYTPGGFDRWSVYHVDGIKVTSFIKPWRKHWIRCAPVNITGVRSIDRAEGHFVSPWRSGRCDLCSRPRIRCICDLRMIILYCFRDRSMQDQTVYTML